MTDIGPGDWVECIDPWWYKALSKGSLYRVKYVVDCHPCGKCNSTTGLSLEELPDPEGGKYCWCGGCMFRPIYRSNTEALLQSLFEIPRILEEELLDPR